MKGFQDVAAKSWTRGYRGTLHGVQNAESWGKAAWGKNEQEKSLREKNPDSRGRGKHTISVELPSSDQNTKFCKSLDEINAFPLYG